MIGDSPAFKDTDDHITIKGSLFRGTEELWELLTRIGKDDLKTYKKY